MPDYGPRDSQGNRQGRHDQQYQAPWTTLFDAESSGDGSVLVQEKCLLRPYHRY